MKNKNKLMGERAAKMENLTKPAEGIKSGRPEEDEQLHFILFGKLLQIPLSFQWVLVGIGNRTLNMPTTTSSALAAGAILFLFIIVSAASAPILLVMDRRCLVMGFVLWQRCTAGRKYVGSVTYTLSLELDVLNSVAAHGGDRNKLDKVLSAMSHFDFEMALYYVRSSDHDFQEQKKAILMLINGLQSLIEALGC
ncbi:hypothetical protein SDJN02_19583, partial [Cucurbita argyrosperma subsp. argyrosperma]